MIKLYDNPFSPFARKVRMVLAYKEIPFRSIDALAKEQHGDLVRANPRAEVPVLDDGGFMVSNSSEIVAYLEDRHPEPRVFPSAPKDRAKARYWERLSDSFVDSVVHDISIWMWPTHQRQDEPPPGLIEAGRRDLEEFIEMMESSLGGEKFLCGVLTVADLADLPASLLAQTPRNRHRSREASQALRVDPAHAVLADGAKRSGLREAAGSPEVPRGAFTLRGREHHLERGPARVAVRERLSRLVAGRAAGGPGGVALVAFSPVPESGSRP